MISSIKISRIQSSLGDSKFYENLLKIALPVVIQNFVAAAVNMIDTVMIGKVGEGEIAAIGIANQFFLIFQLFATGIFSGCGVFISQFWGRRDVKNIRRVLGISLIVGSMVAVLLTSAALAFPDKIIAVFNNEPHIIELGVKYLRIVSISYFFTAITWAFAFSLRCVQNAVIPMAVSIIALITNAFLNYTFIFGHFGAPALGVSGAALATLIARIVETILMLGYVYISKDVLAARLSELIDVTRDFLTKVYKTAFPVVLNELCWGLAFIIYSVVYGRIGSQAIAAVQISSTVQNLFTVIAFGLASASSVMIGNKIGEGEMETGKLYAKRFGIISCLVGLLLGGFLALCTESILSFFEVSQKVRYDTMILLYITSAIMAVRVFNITLIIGILRGGGDAEYALKLEAFTMWGVGVPLAFIGAFVLKLPVYYVAAFVTVEEIVKFCVGITRLKSNKWIKSVINDI